MKIEVNDTLINKFSHIKATISKIDKETNTVSLSTEEQEQELEYDLDLLHLLWRTL